MYAYVLGDPRTCFCCSLGGRARSIYLCVISDLRKIHSQHITKRKTLLIDMCDRCIHSKTRTTSYQESLSESSVAVQMKEAL